jgi:hypothetical protein
MAPKNAKAAAKAATASASNFNIGDDLSASEPSQSEAGYPAVINEPAPTSSTTENENPESSSVLNAKIMANDAKQIILKAQQAQLSIDQKDLKKRLVKALKLEKVMLPTEMYDVSVKMPPGQEDYVVQNASKHLTGVQLREELCGEMNRRNRAYGKLPMNKEAITKCSVMVNGFEVKNKTTKGLVSSTSVIEFKPYPDST